MEPIKPCPETKTHYQITGFVQINFTALATNPKNAFSLFFETADAAGIDIDGDCDDYTIRNIETDEEVDYDFS